MRKNRKSLALRIIFYSLCLNLKARNISKSILKKLSYGGFEFEREICGSDGKDSAYSAGDLSLILGLGRSLGEGNGYPL